MNNLLSQLLFRLAQKEVEQQQLQSRVASLELLVLAVVSTLDDHNLIKFKSEIDQLMTRKTPCGGESEDIRGLLLNISEMAAAHPQE